MPDRQPHDHPAREPDQTNKPDEQQGKVVREVKDRGRQPVQIRKVRHNFTPFLCKISRTFPAIGELAFLENPLSAAVRLQPLLLCARRVKQAGWKVLSEK